MARIETVAVHGGEPRKSAHDAVTTPIVCTATYAFEDTAEIFDYFEGRKEREEYGRYGNPTVRAAERKIAALEGAEDCALFASGMAAGTTGRAEDPGAGGRRGLPPLRERRGGGDGGGGGGGEEGRPRRQEERRLPAAPPVRAPVPRQVRSGKDARRSRRHRHACCGRA